MIGNEATSLDQIAKILVRGHAANKVTNSLQGRYLGSIRGTIVSINDPQHKGQVLVETENTGGYTTQWIPVQNGINGQQSKLLVGSEVLLSAESGDPQKLVVIHVLNSGITPVSRLSVYLENELPPCSENNKGYQLVVDTGSNDYVVTCLNRNNSYLWIASADLSHVHVKADKVEQRDDIGGDIEQDILNDDHVSLDRVSNTTDSQYDRNSKNFNTPPQFYGGFQ